MLPAITSPTLLISERRVRENLARMADRARRHGLALRPHYKTHQSARVSAWMRDYAISEVAVTSLRMAREAAAAGWTQQTVAMPLNPRELPQLERLGEKLELSVLLTDPVTAARLAAHVAKPLRYFIEVDAGYGRSGVPAPDTARMHDIVRAAGSHWFRGFYVHNGHTYAARSPQDIALAHQQLLAVVADLRAAFPQRRDLEFATGDTPSCSTQEDFRGITSIGPGNFVYYDLVQADLGTCAPAAIAACLAAPVVQLAPARGEAIIHGGWVQLGKDRRADGSYGQVVRLTATGDWTWPAEGPEAGARVSKLSQEHGTLQLPRQLLDSLQVGDLVGILPVHACATVHGMRAAGSILHVP